MDRVIRMDDTVRLESWNKSEARRKRDIYIRKLVCTTETLVWPLTPKIFAFIGTAAASFCFMRLEMMPETAMYISWLFLIALLLVLKVFIACLLRYRGWLTSTKVTKKTKIWGLLMNFTIPASATPHCFDHLMPPLPYPNNLKVTVSKFIESMRPVLDDQELDELKAKAEIFLNTIGWRLQFLLLLRAFFKWNWFSDWWRTYVYLSNRKPLFNSSVSGADSYRIDYNRLDRVAVWIHSMWKYFIEGRHNGSLEQIKLNGLVPLCMSTIKNLTGGCRVPKLGCDEFQWHDPLKTGFIVVQSRGHYYKIYMYDDKGAMLAPGTLKVLLEQIWMDSNLRECAMYDPAIFTLLPRDDWATVRLDLQKLAPSALKDVEQAAFMLNLEDDYNDSNGEYYAHSSHGCGRIWMDKSASFTSFKSGKILTTFEHSSFDGIAMAFGKNFTAIEEFYAQKVNGFSWFDKKGLNTTEHAVYNTGSFREPTKIDFGDLSSLQEQFDAANVHLKENAFNIRVGHVFAENADRRIAKKVKISPDALIQLSLQVAVYRLHNKFMMTYQPATLQHFTYGRTENIRPLTMKKKKFVECLGNENLSLNEKFQLLKQASDEHAEITKAAMSMQGIDRHLFALYVIMRGQGLTSEFMEYVVNKGMEAPLCTSCLPAKILDQLKVVSKYDQVSQAFLLAVGSMKSQWKLKNCWEAFCRDFDLLKYSPAIQFCWSVSGNWTIPL